MIYLEQQPAMARDNACLRVHQERRVEPETRSRGGDLRDLLVAVRPRTAGVRR